MQGDGRPGIDPGDQFSPERAEPRLNHGVREGGRDGFGKALEAVYDGNQDVLQAPVLEFVHHRQPEFGPFVLGDPFVGKTAPHAVF